MKEILNYIPGFRSRKVWKMVIAAIYYFTVILMIFDSIGTFLVGIAMPFLFFAIAGIIKRKGRPHIVTAIIALIVVCVGSAISPPQTNNKVDSSVEVARQEDKIDDDKNSEEEIIDNNSSVESDNEKANSSNGDNRNNNVITSDKKNVENNTATEAGTSNAVGTVDNGTSTNNQGGQPNNQTVTTNPTPAPEPQPQETQTPTPAPQPQTTQPSTTQDNRTVFYVPKGKSYHYDRNCNTLARSKEILSGPLQEVIKSHSDPCDVCTK